MKEYVPSSVNTSVRTSVRSSVRTMVLGSFTLLLVRSLPYAHARDRSIISTCAIWCSGGYGEERREESKCCGVFDERERERRGEEIRGRVSVVENYMGVRGVEIMERRGEEMRG